MQGEADKNKKCKFVKNKNMKTVQRHCKLRKLMGVLDIEMSWQTLKKKTKH